MSKHMLRKGDSVPFTQISNEILNATDLSLKAKGLYAFMLSKPNDWHFTAHSMEKQLSEERKSILRILKELINYGLVVYYRDDKARSVYIIYNTPQNTINREQSQNGTAGPKMVPSQNGTVPKRDCINNNISLTNKEILKTPPSPQGEYSAKASGREDKKSSSKSKERNIQKLNLPKEVQQYRKVLIEQVKQLDKTVLIAEHIMLGNDELSIYVDVQGYISSNTRNMFLLSEIEDIWIKLYEYNEARKQSRYLGNTNA